ncbi:hypothetical protein GO305_02085 [Ralstonia solanacearum]|nr:hypothetical protein [Ralstonia solanacearum]
MVEQQAVGQRQAAGRRGNGGQPRGRHRVETVAEQAGLGPDGTRGHGTERGRGPGGEPLHQVLLAPGGIERRQRGKQRRVGRRGRGLLRRCRRHGEVVDIVLPQRLQGAGQPGLAHGRAPDLAAGGARQRALADQHDGVDAERVPLGHGRPHGGGDVARVDAGLLAHFLHDDQPFAGLVLRLDREGRAALGNGGRVRTAAGGFDVVRVMALAAEQHHVLEAAGHEQVAAVEKAHVAGAQVASVFGPGGLGHEDFAVQFGLVPVAAGDAGAADPDLADRALGQRGARARIDDADILAVELAAVADVAAPAGGGHGRGSRVHHGAPLFERCRFDVDAVRRRIVDVGRHQQRRLGQPIGRPNRLAPHAVSGEGGLERFDLAGQHRLRRGHQALHRGQVDAGKARRRGAPRFVGAQAQREAGAGQRGGTLGGGDFEPAQRVGDEGHRRHVDRAVAVGQRQQDPHDQPEIVEQRQPAGDGGVFGGAVLRPGQAAEELQVAQQRAMPVHHALRAAGGAGGVLQEGDRLRRERRPDPGRRLAAQRVEVQDIEAMSGREIAQVVAGGVFDGGVGQDHRGPAVARDVPELGQHAPYPRHARQVDRHAGHARVEAGQQRHHVVDARREQDQRGGARRPALLQGRGAAAHALGQRAVAEPQVVRAVAAEEERFGQRPRPRVMFDPVDQRGAFGQCMRRHRSPQRFHGNRSEAALDGPPQRA